jgi:hypothetical protein
MPEITNEQFEEYEKLKKWAKREGVLKSARDVTKLEDDIDAPIKNCVGMLALLGCEPTYSCCGFDYTGQPFHKSHQYGRPYIIMRSNSRTLDFVQILLHQKSTWYVDTIDKNFCAVQVMCGMNPYWRKEECIHFAEECVIAISWLEKILFQLKTVMFPRIVIEDTNQSVKNDIEYWQYPPKSPWIVELSDIEESLTKK